MNCRQYWLFISLLGLCLNINPAYGQIADDGTTNTSIENDCSSCSVTGGITAGDNLFHSFEQFNIPAGGSVHFVDPGVTNIFGRVTGNSASQINGTLGVSGGDANLFFLNPQGIIFGTGAALDLNGSFLATTADEIQFGDRNFSALPTAQEDLSLLNINPSALFFNQMRQNQPISVNSNADSGTILSVPSEKTLTLLGGQSTDNIPGVDLTFGGIFVPEGNINVGAIKDSGKVNLDSNLRLHFPDDLVKGDISLSQGSGINGVNIAVTGNDISLSERSNFFSGTLNDSIDGSINVSANNLTLAGGSTISTRSQGTAKSADIQIDLQDSLNILGLGINGWQQLLRLSLSESSSEFDTSINTVANGQGKSGDIKIDSSNLNLNGGGWILTTTTTTGSGGNIDLTVSDQILIDSAAISTTTDFNSFGQAGDIVLNTNNLLVQNNSVVASSTIGSGDGGNLTLNVADTIRLRQDIPNEIVPTGIFSNTILGNGAAGNIVLNTSKLIMEDGGELSSSSGSLNSNQGGFISAGGDGGNITVNAQDLIQIRGISANGRFPSGIINSTYSDRPAGDVVINTGKLELYEEAIISASSFGTGAGGDLTVNADESIDLSGTGLANLEQYATEATNNELQLVALTGGLLTNTRTGQGGNTKITTPNLRLVNGSLISTSTVGDGDGGNLNIQTENIDVFTSILASSTIGKGQAGKITIETEQLTTKENGFIATSSTNLGNGGDLTVDATESIRLLESTRSRILPGGLITSSVGLSYPGNVELNTPELTIGKGATINAANGIQNPVIEHFVQNIEIPQAVIENQPLRSVIINAESIDIAGSAFGSVFSGINSSTFSAFPASNIQINTANLSIADGSNISVSSLGTGRAGNLAIVADNFTLTDGASLNATTSSGQGGNIMLDINNLVTLNNEAAIRTDASGMGNGGNIKIDTTFVVASKNSGIFARAEAGQGGNIDISASDLFITPDSSITASATEQLGIDGIVEIETFENSDRYNVVKLPEIPLQADKQVVQACGARGNSKGVFSYTGRGGLPANLLEDNHLSTDIAIADWGESTQLTPQAEVAVGSSLSTLSDSSSPTIVEAAAWQINRQGKVELVSQSRLNAAKMFATPSCFG